MSVMVQIIFYEVKDELVYSTRRIVLYNNSLFLSIQIINVNECNGTNISMM